MVSWGVLITVFFIEIRLSPLCSTQIADLVFVIFFKLKLKGEFEGGLVPSLLLVLMTESALSLLFMGLF